MTDRALVGAADLRDELGAAGPAAAPTTRSAEGGSTDVPLLLDVRWTLAGPDREGYLSGHLPGALFVDLDADLAGAPGTGGRHPLPDPADLTATLGRLGVTAARPVVAYDGGAGAAAARAWWCLRWVGLTRVRVLDGGLPAWVRAGGSLETGDVVPVPRPAPVPVPGRAAPAGRSMPVVSADDVLAGRVGTLLDARAPERFRGEVEPVDPVAGHIPGALSCPTTSLQDGEGRYLPPARLRALLAPVAGADGVAAAYCGSGVTASQLVLAAHEAGVELALYPGSWSHWVQDPARPVATG